MLTAPEARTEGLLVEELAGELLVYDLDQNEAHCLNAVAAAIWRSCNGRRGIPELVALLERELATPVDVEVLRLALDRLAAARLLKQRPSRVCSRRALVRAAGATASLAALLPVVASIVVPTPAMAGSCNNGVGNGEDCQPPGLPPINDGSGTGPGSPGRGGGG